MFDWSRNRLCALPGMAIAILCLTLSPASAHHRGHRGHGSMPAGATEPGKDAALILDGETGRVLYARNEAAERHPASLTKMMTLYLLFEAMKRGDV